MKYGLFLPKEKKCIYMQKIEVLHYLFDHEYNFSLQDGEFILNEPESEIKLFSIEEKYTLFFKNDNYIKFTFNNSKELYDYLYKKKISFIYNPISESQTKFIFNGSYYIVDNITNIHGGIIDNN